MQNKLNPTYYIKTLGCQANVADSQKISGVLEALGYEEITEPYGINETEVLNKALRETDLFIVNTCSVRQKSEDKVYGLGKILKKIKEETGKKPTVVMAGCMVGSATGERQRIAFEELKKKTPWVEIYISPAEIMSLPQKLLEKNLLNESAVATFDPKKVNSKVESIPHAFVNISFGCDNFCTFCVVPYARGKENSRTEEEILNEIKHLTARGFKEFTLCGQNVNSWSLDTVTKFEVRAGSDHKLPFADLLRKVHAIPEVEKISFLSSNPFDFTNDLLDAVKLPKITNYLHIAVQSGNNEVLKRMNRRHTIEDFTSLISRIKDTRPEMEIGTDIIVGFPGETREQFMDTVRLFETVKFNVAFISIYSPRKGTPAEKHFKDDVPAKEKKWRHSYLTKVWRASLKTTKS